VSVKLTIRMKLSSEHTQEVNNTRLSIVTNKAIGEPQIEVSTLRPKPSLVP